MPVRSPIYRSLLRVPLFHKILVANLGIVLVLSASAAALAARTQVAPTGLTLLLAIAGGALVVVVNAVILRAALSPLEALEEAAERVSAGDLDSRVATSPLADRRMAQLIGIFNGMLDAVADARGRQRELASRALDAAEQERKRVAGDLHDKTAQALAGLLVQLNLAAGARDEAVRNELLGEAAQAAAAAMDETYRIVQALRPPTLELLGLRGAIESHARALSEQSGMTIEVDSEDVRDALNEASEIATYRIVQEALSNVVRHSRASRAAVSLRRSADGVVIVIEDNGVGFAAPEALRSSGSLGLFGMQERASYLGGSVAIQSTAQGTTVNVAIPVTEDI